MKVMTAPSPAAKALKKMRNKTGLSRYALAKLLGIPASSYQHYEVRYKKEFLPLDLVAALRPIFKSKGIPGEEIDELAGLDGLSPAQSMKVPIISWVEAGRMVETTDPWPPGDADEFITVDAKESDSLIALRVTGTSMNKIAPPGAVIIVDLTQRDVIDNRFYVVRHGGIATFKRYRSSPPRLEPFSTDDHPTLFPEELEVVGRVVKVVHDL